MKYFLLTSVFIVAIASLLVSIALMSIPDGSLFGLDPSWLQSTRFRDYLFPGLIVFVFIGFPSVAASYVNIVKHSNRYGWSILLGVVLCLQSIIQGLYISQLFWINTLMLLLGLMIIATAFQLRGKTMI